MSGPLPQDPVAFAEFVASSLRRICPARDIQLSGPMDMLIDGWHLSLDNLYRMVSANPARSEEIVEGFLHHLLEGEAATVLPLPLEVARGRIMPRIQPETIFRQLERNHVVHLPFVNDTVVVYVLDMPHMTISLTVEQMVKWNLTVDEIDSIARANLRMYVPDLRIRFLRPEMGGRAAVFAENDGYDASRLLLDNLFPRLAPELGGNFWVATPARDTFVAMTAEPDRLHVTMHEKVETEFRRLPYPITDRYFLVTMDGVAGTCAA